MEFYSIVMENPTISIIIPVYNAAGYLERCVDSILSQGYASLQVILVDDGSTDSSPEICDMYSKQDNRVICVHKDNGGVSSARNCGLSKTEGEYVMFVDSDDTLAEGALNAIISIIHSSSPDFILGGYDIYTNGVYDRSCRVSESRNYENGYMEAFFEDAIGEVGELLRSPWAKLYRRKIIQRAGLRFNESLSYAEDKLFVYGFLNHADTAATINVSVYDYYRHSGTLSWGRTDVVRASRLLDMLPHYSEALILLSEKYPDCDALRRVYHNDLFCGDIMRVFRVLMKYRTPLLSQRNIRLLYSIMDKDTKMLFAESRVPGQLLVSFFYCTGLHALSVWFCRLTSSVLSFFRF